MCALALTAWGASARADDALPGDRDWRFLPEPSAPPRARELDPERYEPFCAGEGHPGCAATGLFELGLLGGGSRTVAREEGLFRIDFEGGLVFSWRSFATVQLGPVFEIGGEGGPNATAFIASSKLRARVWLTPTVSFDNALGLGFLSSGVANDRLGPTADIALMAFGGGIGVFLSQSALVAADGRGGADVRMFGGVRFGPRGLMFLMTRR